MHISKKIMAIVLALLMVLGLPFAVSANDTPLTLVSAHINSNSDVVLTFSEPIAYTGTLDIRLYTVDENLNSTIDNSFPTWSYWWVKIDGYYAGSTSQLAGKLKIPNSQDNQSYEAVKGFRDQNHPGKPLKFAVWEAASGTTASNGFVDNITSADGTKKLAASKTAARDIAMVDPTEGSIGVNNGKPLTLLSALVNPKTNNEVVLTFSEPIVYSGSLDIRLYTVDGNLNSTIDNTFPVWSYWWVELKGYYGSSNNQLVGTLKIPGSQNTQNYKDVVTSLGANAANLRFALWENASGTTASNGLVDNITSIDGSKKLEASKTATRDIAMVKPTQDTVTVTSMKVLDDKTGQITFSEGIVEGLYRGDVTTWKSIRLVNERMELQKYDPSNANAWLQWGITMHATDDPAVWNFTINGGYRNVTSFSQLAELVRPGGDFAGMKITFAIEQNTKNSELTNVVDNITSLDGQRPLTATNDATAVWPDGLYIEIGMPPVPVAYLKLSDTQARILLAGAAKVGSAKPMVDNVAATALTLDGNSSYGTTVTATFPAGTLDALPSMVIPANTFLGLTGTGNEAATVLDTETSFDGVTEKVTLKEDKTYSFMNADTGREIAIGGESEFVASLTSEELNLYNFYLGSQYLDLTGATPALADDPINYQLIACENGRYQIFIANGYAVCDTDAGTSNVPTLGLSNNDSIATGWYLTEEGQTRPLRILPIGDSITYGTNPDAQAPLMGWRDDLSKGLSDKLDRYVFVGNQTTYVTSVDSHILTRHEGNPGWTVKDHGDRPGIYDLVPATVDKYDPDVVLLMIGINDMAVYASGGYTNAERDEMKANYRDLVVALSANMDQTDTIFCSRLTPMSSGHSMYSLFMPELFNDTWDFDSWVDAWAAEGLPVKLNDNYAALVGRTGVICSDGIHLSVNGDPFVAQQYANSLMSVYDRNGNLLGEQYQLQALLNLATAGTTVTLQADHNTLGTGLVRVPAGVTLDLNGHTVKADNILVFGSIIDSTQGEGALTVDARGTAIIMPTNPMLPLYDSTKGGYRFFNATVTNKTPQSGEGFVKYGFNLKFGNEDAYRLLLDSANADVTLSTAIAVTGNATLNYVFGHSILATYAQSVLDNMARENNFVVTLKISGLERLTEGAAVTATPSLTSGLGVIKTGNAQTYTRPFYASDLNGNYAYVVNDNGTITEYFVTVADENVSVGLGIYDPWDNFLAGADPYPTPEQAEELWNMYLSEGAAVIIDGVRYVTGMGLGTEGTANTVSKTGITYTAPDPEDDLDKEFSLSFTFDPVNKTMTVTEDTLGLLLTNVVYTKK